MPWRLMLAVISLLGVSYLSSEGLLGHYQESVKSHPAVALTVALESANKAQQAMSERTKALEAALSSNGKGLAPSDKTKNAKIVQVEKTEEIIFSNGSYMKISQPVPSPEPVAKTKSDPGSPERMPANTF